MIIWVQKCMKIHLKFHNRLHASEKILEMGVQLASGNLKIEIILPPGLAMLLLPLLTAVQ